MTKQVDSSKVESSVRLRGSMFLHQKTVQFFGQVTRRRHKDLLRVLGESLWKQHLADELSMGGTKLTRDIPGIDTQGKKDRMREICGQAHQRNMQKVRWDTLMQYSCPKNFGTMQLFGITLRKTWFETSCKLGK